MRVIIHSPIQIRKHRMNSQNCSPDNVVNTLCVRKKTNTIWFVVTCWLNITCKTRCYPSDGPNEEFATCSHHIMYLFSSSIHQCGQDIMWGHNKTIAVHITIVFSTCYYCVWYLLTLYMVILSLCYMLLLFICTHYRYSWCMLLPYTILRPKLERGMSKIWGNSSFHNFQIHMFDSEN